MKKKAAQTISAFDFMEKFPSEASAREYLENLRWGGDIECPHCLERDRATVVKGREGYYKCKACRKVYTVRGGTIFHRSSISLKKWLFAMYLLQTSRKGISSLQLSKEIGITQKSSWFLLQRLREACKAEGFTLSGTVEIDKTDIGGKQANRHWNQRKHDGQGPSGKQAVLGCFTSMAR